MSQILLSYTALDDLIKHPHTWLNKQMGITKPVSPAMEAGKVAHKVIQDHCLGVKKDPRLSDLTWTFTKSEHHARKGYNDAFALHGFIDLIGFDSKVMCEIKTSTKPWGQQKFHDLIQWKYYAFVTGFRKVLFITCTKDLENLKTFYADVTDDHIREAEAWVKKGVAILEAGDFLQDTPCQGCSYGINCLYR